MRLCVLALGGVLIAGPAAAQDVPDAETPTSAPESETAETPDERPPSPDSFTPSEEISLDLPVSFPVDI